MPKAWKTAVKILLVYLAVFTLWLYAAEKYHLLLGRMAGKLIPLVESCSVDRIWYEDGIRYEISFYDPESRQILTAKGVVDAEPYGYPMVTFLVLAIAFSGLKEWKIRKKFFLAALGAGLLFFLYSSFIVVAVYEFLGQYEAPLLKGNWIARLLPPALYARYEIPLLVFLGQVIPVFLWAVLFGWPLFTAKKASVRP